MRLHDGCHDLQCGACEDAPKGSTRTEFVPRRTRPVTGRNNGRLATAQLRGCVSARYLSQVEPLLLGFVRRHSLTFCGSLDECPAYRVRAASLRRCSLHEDDALRFPLPPAPCAHAGEADRKEH